MASVKIILRAKEKLDGSRPLVVQIIKDRRPSIISLGHSIKVDDWDEENHRVKKSHPNHARLNNLIAKRVAEVTDKLLELQTNAKDTTAQTVRRAYVGTKNSTFKKQADIYKDTLDKKGKYNQLSADKSRIERFLEFAGDIGFADITTHLLKRFAASLKGERKVSDRTVMNHLVVIRSIFNQAIQAKVADPKYYPFGKGGVKIKFPDSAKVGLNGDEIKKLETVKLKGPEHHARNLWLFSFYNAGMRVSDVLRLRTYDIQDGRLHYTMGKNQKGGSLKLAEKSKKILNEYSENNHDLVFPDLAGLESMDNPNDVQRRIKTRVHEINDSLSEVATKAKINKHLTFHISRHSFAQLAGDKIPLPILQKLYRHTSITTTLGYQSNFTNKDTDKALDNVLDF